MEIKPVASESESHEAVHQLCGYLRQVLREQPNRRFVMGLTLCLDKLNVWLCDRSGLLGMATPINIHEVSLYSFQDIVQHF